MAQSMNFSSNQEFVNENEETTKQSQENVLIRESHTSENTNKDLPVDNIEVKNTQSVSCSSNQEFVSDNVVTEKQSKEIIPSNDSNILENTNLDLSAGSNEIKMTQLTNCNGNQILFKDIQSTEKDAK